jgi:adenylate cyclase
MADIFVSYASEDRDRIKPLIELLEGEGWSVWWDRELVAGPSFEEKIEEALEAARCVVVAWSESSIKSRWCRAEANDGAERDLLVPVRVDDVRPPLAFRSSHTASLIGWPARTGEVGVLLAGVRECLGTPSVFASASTDREIREAIAVLPFANMSNDPDQAFFCEGMSAELINALVAFGNFDVIARTSSFQFRQRDEDVRKIASILGAKYILEGSVRKSGERVRVTAELVDGTNGMHLWSGRYESVLTDIFSVQDEITTAILQALTHELGSHPLSRGGTQNPQAYEAYLQGKYELAAGVMEIEAARRALPHLDEAVRLDPAFADAWGTRAHAGFMFGLYDPDFEQMHESIGRALALQPSQADALAVQACLHWYQRYDGQSTLDALAECIRRRPSDYETLTRFAWVCWYLDQETDFLELAARIIGLDPLRELGYRFRAIVHRKLGRREESVADVRRALELGPNDLHMREVMVLDARERGDGHAIEKACKQYRARVGPDSFLAEAFEAEDPRVALEHLKSRERPGGNMRILDAARAYSYLGDHEAAITKFGEYVGANRSFLRLNYARNHLLQPLLNYPRYQKILAGIGCDDATAARIRVPSVV